MVQIGKCSRLARTAAVAAVLLLVVGGVFNAAAGGSAEDEAEVTGVQRLNMGAGWVTGVYYPLAGAMSRIAHTSMDNISLTVESSGASVVNSNLIGAGDLDLAIVQNDVAFYAFNGVRDFEGNQVTNMRGLFMLHPEPIQLVVRADSGIESVADLAGQRVAVGPLGSGAEVNALQVLEAAGLSEGDLASTERLEAGEAADFLRDGRIDAAFFTVGIGASVIADLAVGTDISLVNIDGDVAETMLGLQDFYATVDIPADTYSGVDAASTVTVVSMVVARDDINEDLIYEFVSGVFGNLEVLRSAHAAGSLVTLERALDGMPFALHPGAERFFEEQGRL